MTILNRSKVPKRVLKLMDSMMQVQTKMIFDYVNKHEEPNINFLNLWQKILKYNDKFMRKEGTLDDYKGLLTKEEMLYLAKLFRYMSDKVAELEQQKFPISEDVKIINVIANDVPAEWQIVPNAMDDHVILYIHGGGFVMGSPNDHRLLTVEIGYKTRFKILSIDYRLAPENPFPAGLEDCVKTYKWLLSEGCEPKNIIIAGDSAGGNFTLSTLLKLKDENITLPAGAICLSPSTDLTGSDDTFFKNAETDPVLADVGLFWWIEAYLGDNDPYNPYISPLWGDLKGLPPILLQVSSTEMLYGDSKRFYEKAKAEGVDVKLEVWNDMPHVFQGFGLRALPEAREALDNIAKFVKKIV